jgi:hypothetical protein
MNSLPGSVRLIRSLARQLAMVTIWLTATGFFGMAFFRSGGRRARVEEAVIFAVAFAGAAAVSAVITLAMGGKRHWAVVAALPMAIVLATPVGIASVLSGLAPAVGWKLRRLSYFPLGGGEVSTVILGIARQTIPTGAILGVVIGTLAGLLTLLASRRPRLVGWLVGGLLLSCVIGSVHIDAFGRVIDFVLRMRLEGVNRLVVSWTIAIELAATMGATAGALVGAVVACWTVRIGG